MDFEEYRKRYEGLSKIAEENKDNALGQKALALQDVLVQENGGLPPPVTVGLKPAINSIRRA